MISSSSLRWRSSPGANTRMRCCAQVDHAVEALAHAHRPGEGHHGHAQLALDLVHQVQRVAHLAVHLVDEGDDRRVARAADLEQAPRLRLDAVGRVDHHQRRVHGGQHAVGVFGEVLVAGRVEQVDDAVAVLHLHHRTRDRDAALLLDLHPVARWRGAWPCAPSREPAIWIAPENSSSFSVSVVLPASGWEMMAKVLLRLTCSAIGPSDISTLSPICTQLCTHSPMCS